MNGSASTSPGVVVDVPAALWDAARDGYDEAAYAQLAGMGLDAEVGDGSWLEPGEEFCFNLSRPDEASIERCKARGYTPEDQITGFIAFLSLALIWSNGNEGSIVLRRVDRPLSATYRVDE